MAKAARKVAEVSMRSLGRIAVGSLSTRESHSGVGEKIGFREECGARVRGAGGKYDGVIDLT